MAEGFARLLLDAINSGIQREQKDKELSNEKQRTFNENETRKEAHDIAVKQLEQQHEQFEANHQLLSQQAAIKVLETKQEIGKSIAQGIPVPGVQTAPAAEGTSGALFSPANPAQATQQIATLPQELGGGQMTVPSPTKFATDQANLQKILDRPKVEAKIEEARSLQADLLKKQEEAKVADFNRSMMQKAWDDARAAEMRTSQEKIARGHDDATRFVALHRNALPEEWQSYNLAPHIQDAMTGVLTREDFVKMALPKPVKDAIEVGVKSAGGNFLDKKQQESLGDYTNLTDVVGTMDKLLDILPKTQSNSRIATGLAGLGEVNNRDIKDLKNRLEGSATIIGRAVSKDNRVSDQDAKRVGMGFFQDEFNSIKNNVEKREDFVRKVSNAIDARLVGVSPAQKQIIKQRLGLTTIAPYQLRTPAPAPAVQNPNQPRNWTPDGSWMK
jgi:hypothetical protein